MLLYQSGFVYPQKAEYVNQVSSELENTWVKVIGASPQKVGAVFIARVEGHWRGTVSLTRFGDHSWLIHQLATHPSAKTSWLSLRLMIHVITLLLSMPDAHFVFLYYREENKSVARFYKRLKTRLDTLGSAIEIAAQIGNDFMERRGGANFDENNFYPVELSQVSSASEFADANLVTVGNTLVDQALGLGTNLFATANVTEAYQGLFLNRTRRIIRATLHGRTLGCAVVDNFPVGMNLSGLLDAFRLFLSDGLDAETNRRATCALGLAAAGMQASVRNGTSYALLAGKKYSLDEFGFVKIRRYEQIVFDLRIVRNHPTALRTATRAHGLSV